MFYLTKFLRENIVFLNKLNNKILHEKNQIESFHLKEKIQGNTSIQRM